MRRRVLVGSALLLLGCSSNHDANPAAPPPRAAPGSVPSSDSVVGSSGPSSTGAPSAGTGATATEPADGATTSAPQTTSPLVVTGTAVAGALGGVEPGGPPFTQTDPFAEAVRLADGTCVGWDGSRGGSTAGLAVGAPVVVLDAEVNEEIGSGTITASRWVDMAGGGEQWNCSFDFSATLTGPHAEFRIRVAALAPWLARPDPTVPGMFVASVSTDASTSLIPECPVLAPPATTPPGSAAPAPSVPPTTPPPTVAGPPATGWSAIGQYWSRGVASLCAAGLPVTAIARPCRPPGAGSEYITAVVDSADPTVRYDDGAAVPVGTELTVVVATGRACG